MAIWLHETNFEAYLRKWLEPEGFRWRFVPGWQTRSRGSGGFSEIKGFQVHHAASKPTTTLASTINWATVTSPDEPVGNGTFSRDKDGPVLVIWASGAANTAGRGGPRLSSRGAIPLDSANSRTLAWEAENNGVGEPWSPRMQRLMVLTYCACIDWANNETPGADLGVGDIFGHFEWAPGRKIDPWGPSAFSGGENVQWNMNAFRGAVFAALLAGPTGGGEVPPPPPVGRVPNPPTNLSLKIADSTSMVAAWAGPADFGTSPLTAYVVQWREHVDNAKWLEKIVAPATKAWRIDAKQGSRYEVRVLARNDVGSSGWTTSAVTPSYVTPPPASSEQTSAAGPRITAAPSPEQARADPAWLHTIMNQNGWRDVRGWFGAGTAAILGVFQQEQGLVVNGVFNYATALALKRVWSNSPWTKSITSTPGVMDTIEQGKGGPDVTWLHQSLIEAAYLDVFDFWGGGTRSSIIAMSKKLVVRGLLGDITGIYDQETAAALAAYLKNPG